MKKLAIMTIATQLCGLGTGFGEPQGGPPEDRGPDMRGERAEGGLPGDESPVQMVERMGEQGGMLARTLRDPRVAEELGLSEEQSATLRKSFSEERKKMIDLKAGIEKAAIEQADCLSADVVDEKAVMDAVNRIGELRTEIARLRVMQLLAVKKTLTPEQHEKLRAMMRERGEKRREEHGERREGMRREGPAPFRGEPRSERPEMPPPLPEEPR